ncbi:hypothetical protein CAY53_00120 [Desulfobulbus oralis]|uniref:Antitoxin SocA-like Panacea domain-containing protein n=2 Tax=Desulfobulbus oralis TaxID=1986146 RepID=A0A2L1GK78_9BACT|nr:hypothetical protein CAY53_00120 [Desulfobulbus oralis]
MADAKLGMKAGLARFSMRWTMVEAVDVAAYILTLTGPVTTMKLQKLVFYTQARFLVKNGKPLFRNRIEAWINGPVVPDLFHRHTGMFMIGPGQLAASAGLSDRAREAASAVVRVLGPFSGEQLRQLSHNEKPWQDARHGREPEDRSDQEISIEAMRTFYSSPECANPALR